MAILNFKSRCSLDSKSSSSENVPVVVSVEKSVNEKMESVENRFPNSEFQNLSLNEKNGEFSSGDEGDRSSSDDEKTCTHHDTCDENGDFFCDFLTEECLIESLSNSEQVLRYVVFFIGFFFVCQTMLTREPPVCVFKKYFDGSLN